MWALRVEHDDGRVALVREPELEPANGNRGRIHNGRAGLLLLRRETRRRVHRLDAEPVAVDGNAQVMRRKRGIVYPHVVVRCPPHRQGLALLEVATVHRRQVGADVALQPLLRVGPVLLDFLNDGCPLRRRERHGPRRRSDKNDRNSESHQKGGGQPVNLMEHVGAPLLGCGDGRPARPRPGTRHRRPVPRRRSRSPTAAASRSAR